MDPDPTHTLVDPDLSDASGTLDWSGSPKPRSSGQKQRGMGRVVNRPGLLAYIRETGPVQAIFTLLSLSSLRLLSSLLRRSHICKP